MPSSISEVRLRKNNLRGLEGGEERSGAPNSGTIEPYFELITYFFMASSDRKFFGT